MLKAYRLSPGRLAMPPYAQGQVVSPGHPGRLAHRVRERLHGGTGIVWASMPTGQDGLHGRVAGILRAFNAETLQEIWTSEQNAAPRPRWHADEVRSAASSSTAGSIMPNHDGAVAVFGRLPAPATDFTLAVTPSAAAIAPGQTGTFTVTVGAGGFAGDVTLNRARPGATVSFAPSSIAGAGTATMCVAAGRARRAVCDHRFGHERAASAPRRRCGSPPGWSVPSGSASLESSALPMAAGESAGVVPQANWNNAAGGARTSEMSLVDASEGRPLPLTGRPVESG